MKPGVKLLFIISLFLLYSCGNTNIAFVSDPYWYKIVSSKLSVKASLRRATRGLNTPRPDFILLADAQEIEFKLYPEGESQYTRLVFTPLAYHWWRKTHGNEENVQVAVAGNLNHSGQDAAFFVENDRLEAFSRAGESAGLYTSSRGEDAVTVLHVLSGNEKKKREVEAFTESFNKNAEPGNLILHKVSDPENSRLDFFESQIENRQVVCRGYFIPFLNETLFNNYKDPSLLIFTENVQGCGASFIQDIYTIEKDYDCIMRLSFEQLFMQEEIADNKVSALLVKYRSPKKIKK